MILFLHGEDNFRSRQKLNQIKDKYQGSQGDLNLVTLDSSNINIDDFTSAIQALPFLTKKRLVIIENLLSGSRKDLQGKIAKELDSIPETCVLIFFEEGEVDKRSLLFKKLNKPKVAYEFNSLNPTEITKWIKNEAEKRGGKINPLATEVLASYVGNDLWQMNQEIDKLTNYNKEVTAENINLLVNAKLSNSIFDMVDAIGQRNSQKATKILEQLLESGENEIYLLSMIIRQMRNILMIKDLAQNTSSYTKIAEELKLHPFVVKKALSQGSNFSFDELKKIYQKLLDTDIAVKTGQIDSVLALDLLVIGLCEG